LRSRRRRCGVGKVEEGKVEERKQEALWHFIEARLEEVLEKAGLPLEALPALEAGYLAAHEDFAPGILGVFAKEVAEV
jgi:hypothetical protein